jgi:hypothetical protein
LPWRKKLKEADERLERAVRLRDAAQVQQDRVKALNPRVDEASSRLGQLRTDNHFGPLIDSLLRGNE